MNLYTAIQLLRLLAENIAHPDDYRLNEIIEWLKGIEQ